MPLWKLNIGLQVVRVTQLWCFPIKSCAGSRVEEAEIDRLGLVDDRRRVIVDPQTHKFITQRQFPKMCLIRPSFDKTDGHLIIDAPDMPTLHVVEPNDAAIPRVTITVCFGASDSVGWWRRVLESGGHQCSLRSAAAAVIAAAVVAVDGGGGVATLLWLLWSHLLTVFFSSFSIYWHRSGETRLSPSLTTKSP